MDSSVGGLIQGISLGAFLQMVQMEKKTCTLTIRSTEGVGRLYVYNGDLIAAETETQIDKEAAYEIIGWDDTLIEIDDTCLKKKKEIDQPLMSILMQGLKVKDDKDNRKPSKAPARKPKDPGIADDLSTETEPAGTNDDLIDLHMAAEGLEAAVTPAQKSAGGPVDGIPLTQVEDLQGMPTAGGGYPDDAAALMQSRQIIAEKRRVAEEIERKSRPMREAAAKEAAIKKKQRIKLISIGAAVTLILAIVAVIAFQKIQEKRTQEKYTIAVTRAESATLLEDKEVILLNFVENYPDHPEISTARELLSGVQIKIENRDFADTVKRVESIPMGDDYVNKAVSAYQEFLNKYPGGYHAQDALSRIDNIPSLLDDRDFAEIKKLEASSDSVKIKAYAQYLTKYPNGNHRKKVEALIAEMSEEYYAYLKTEIEECEEKEEWSPCINLCSDFANFFSSSRHTQELNTTRQVMLDKQDYKELQNKAVEISPDYPAVISMYQAYLEKNPKTYRATAIQKDIDSFRKKDAEEEDWKTVQAYARNPSVGLDKRIQKVKQYINDTTTNAYMKDSRALLRDLDMARSQDLKQQSEKQKLRQQQESTANQQQEQKRINAELKKAANKLGATGGRFVAASGDTVIDNKTGLVWTMLDSTQLLGKCVTHRDAQKFVRSLKTGGFSDWRLPSANELVVIYKNKPFFPSGGSAWYWTSDVYTKGYHQIANIVTTKAETAWDNNQQKTDQCGAARAVRP